MKPAQPVPDRRTPSPSRPRWRRLLVALLVPVLALTATSANAQGVWLTLPSPPTARSLLAAAAAPCPDGLRNGCVYAVGGFGTRPSQRTLEAYSPATNAWAFLPPMPTGRENLAAASAPCPQGLTNTCVYAIGGVAPPLDRRLDTAEAYSPATNAWATVPSMPTARSNLAGAAAPCPGGLGLRGTCVYAMGGISAGQAVGTVEAYSPATNTWATLPSLPTPRSSLVGAAAPCPDVPDLRGTCVYAIGGGFSEARTVEAYSPATNSWATLPSLPTTRLERAAAAAPCPDGVNDTCVYVVGGVDLGGEGLATVEAYSPAANTWLDLPSMTTARRQLAAAGAPCPDGAQDGCLYAIGGTSDPSAEAFAIERGATPPAATRKHTADKPSATKHAKAKHSTRKHVKTRHSTRKHAKGKHRSGELVATHRIREHTQDNVPTAKQPGRKQAPHKPVGRKPAYQHALVKPAPHGRPAVRPEAPRPAAVKPGAPKPPPHKPAGLKPGATNPTAHTPPAAKPGAPKPAPPKKAAPKPGAPKPGRGPSPLTDGHHYGRGVPKPVAPQHTVAKPGAPKPGRGPSPLH